MVAIPETWSVGVASQAEHSRVWARTIRELRRKHSLDLLLEIKGLSRSTYYYHTARMCGADKYATERERNMK